MPFELKKQVGNKNEDYLPPKIPDYIFKMQFMIYPRLVPFIICFFMATALSAQDDYYFTRGLSAMGLHRYGREALYTDKLAYQLYTGTLKKPEAGASLGATNNRGEDIKWQAIEADTAHRFRTRGGFGGGGGYLYLTYEAEKEKTALLHITGNSSVFVNGELHAGDPYSSGWLYIPVILKKGLNEFYVRSGGQMVVKIVFPKTPVQINTGDPTLPFIVLGEDNSLLKGAVVVINSSKQSLKGYQLKSALGGKEKLTALPEIPALSTRKVIFEFDGTSVDSKGQHTCSLSLLKQGRSIDEKTILIESVGSTEKYSQTFVSEIDGSLQYYAVTPQAPATSQPSALFLSVHGAGVEAIGQARAYKQKDWGTLVAATNRRPRGFNWEDWGRLDALEVLSIAKAKFNPDPQKIFLTGHSMGGHGTWFLGATYPDKWAAIAPCAGYPTLKGYGSADGLIPENGGTQMEQILLRASNQSDVPRLATNYKPLGVYIFHGDSDRTVSVNYARQMRKQLGEFHTDMSYYEYPRGEHWFGDISVDWDPLFDFFKWHKLAPDSSFDIIDFSTASPGISASYRWSSVEQQFFPLEYSRVQLKRDRKSGIITGKTENARIVKLKLDQFPANMTLRIILDSLNPITYKTRENDSLFLAKTNNGWMVVGKPDTNEKGPHRYGTFKDPFNHRMVFVYGTKGNKSENKWSLDKARYDAETWYYRGNGAVDIISDNEYSINRYSGRNVILYGNASTNSAYNLLLADCPIRVERNKLTAGAAMWQGDDLGAYFAWPLKNSQLNVVGVICGTGLKGMQSVNANQYFAGASGFADFMIYKLDMIKSGTAEVKMAGFFDHNWQLSPDNFVINR